MLRSNYRSLAAVALPFQGRQHYMHGFDLANPVMLAGFEDYLEPVQTLIDAAGAHFGKAYMTVDEKIVAAGGTQRRPGPHIDGVFRPTKNAWDGGGGGGWNHSCSEVPFSRMPIIVAASAVGCKVWRGDFDTQPNAMGGLEHIADQLGDGELVPANVGFLLSGDCIHESLPFTQPTQRSFLRIALPVEFNPAL